MGVSAPAPPLSFLQTGQGALSGRAPLCGAEGLEYCCGICADVRKIAQAMGLVEGLTMQRQSRSPRARPSTSISAEARLLA